MQVFTLKNQFELEKINGIEDFRLMRLRKSGKPHPLLDVRLKIAAYHRENLKLIGLKRVSKALIII